MAEPDSEEFKEFILKNRDMIEAILNEGKARTEETVKEKVSDAGKRAKELNDTVLTILSNDDVQRHFITGCLEFMHFFESVIEATPMSPDAREVVDKFKETRDITVKNVVMTGAKDKMESIEINEVKSTPKSKAGAKTGKTGNIKVNDVKPKKKE